MRSKHQLAIDFLADDELEELTNADLLQEGITAIEELNAVVNRAAASIDRAVGEARATLATIKARLDSANQTAKDELDQINASLQARGQKPGEYLDVEKRIGTLKPLKKDSHGQDRRGDRSPAPALGSIGRGGRASRTRDCARLQAAAKKVDRSLKDVVRAAVMDGQDRSILTRLLRSKTSGRVDLVVRAIEEAELLSVRGFVDTCRKGAVAIREAYPLVTLRARGETLVER